MITVWRYELPMIITITPDNAEQIGRCIINEILTAHQTRDYQLLTRHFSQKYKDVLTIERFEQAVDEAILPLGQLVSCDYLGYLKRVNEHQLLWRVRFEHSDEDLLWQLYLCDDEAPVQVVALWFS